MILGRTVWTRTSGAWRHETFPAGNSRAPIARLSEILSSPPPQRAVVIFEAESVSHQAVETPKVSRAAFASLVRVRDQHPVVESEDLGWGMEPPDKAPGGSFSTMIHAELTPGLVRLQDACAGARCPLAAAWSAYTVAAACAGPGRSPRTARHVLILAPDFVALASIGGGKRYCRTWMGPLNDRDWKALAGLVGDGEPGPSTGSGDPGVRRGGVVVVAEGEPDRLCPIWSALRETGRVEAILDLDAFALKAARIPVAHPANLVEAFPRPRELDRLLAGSAVVGFVAALGLGTMVLGDRRRVSALDLSERQRVSSLEAQISHLAGNRQEMGRLRSEAPDGFGPLPPDMKGALVRLASGLPETLTLSYLSMGADRSFELEAVVVGGSFDPPGARRALEKCGFSPADEKGWAYEAASGRLSLRGRFDGGRP
jgi:hypothetical protein